MSLVFCYEEDLYPSPGSGFTPLTPVRDLRSRYIENGNHEPEY